MTNHKKNLISNDSNSTNKCDKLFSIGVKNKKKKHKIDVAEIFKGDKIKFTSKTLDIKVKKKSKYIEIQIEGIKGPTGPTGPIGPTGSTGPTGPSNIIPGPTIFTASNVIPFVLLGTEFSTAIALYSQVIGDFYDKNTGIFNGTTLGIGTYIISASINVQQIGQPSFTPSFIMQITNTLGFPITNTGTSQATIHSSGILQITNRPFNITNPINLKMYIFIVSASDQPIIISGGSFSVSMVT